VESRRVYYIDWLRVLAVLLLFLFHSGRVFNWGELFYAKSSIDSLGISLVLWFIDAWHMPLLFFLAGASTYFAMRKRTIAEYLRERSLRLLVPLSFGVLVLVPPQTWYGARTNDGYTGSFLDYLTSGRAFSPDNLFGRGDYYGGLSPAHLWFILFLFIISVLVVPLLVLDRKPGGSASLGRVAGAFARPAWWPVVVFLILVAEAMPEIGGKNLIYYLVFFVLGYLLIGEASFADTATRWRIPALVAGFGITAASVLLGRWADTLPDPSMALAGWRYVELLGGWLSLVGLIGLGRAYLDTPSPTLAYLSEASYPLYILHQTLIVTIGFYLVMIVPWPALGWPLLIAVSAAVTFAVYGVVRRVGALRFLFGMRPKRPTAAPHA